MTNEEILETLKKAGAQCEDWNGRDKWVLTLGEDQISFVLPKAPLPGRPWFWRPEFFGAFAGIDHDLLDAGWTKVFLNKPDHYGSQPAVDAFDRMHDFAAKLGCADKGGIVAMSRAGLSAYHFAAQHPEKVLAIYADNPVCDFRSWPFGLWNGKGSEGDCPKLLKVYGLTDAEARAYVKQPWAVLEPIVKAGIPLFHVCGDSDDVVPYEENTEVLVKHLKALGGSCQEIVIPERGHHPHGLEDTSPLMTFFKDAWDKAYASESKA